MQLYAVLGMLLIIAAGVTYIDRSATARHEAAALAKATSVQRESTSAVISKSKTERAAIQTNLALSKKQSAAFRARAETLEAKIAEMEAAPVSTPEGPLICQIGCKPRW